MKVACPTRGAKVSLWKRSLLSMSLGVQSLELSQSLLDTARSGKSLRKESFGILICIEVSIPLSVESVGSLHKKNISLVGDQESCADKFPHPEIFQSGSRSGSIWFVEAGAAERFGCPLGS